MSKRRVKKVVGKADSVERLRKALAKGTKNEVVDILVLKQANAGGVRHGCFIEISDDAVSSQR
jgi:hypothetical protein